MPACQALPALPTCQALPGSKLFMHGESSVNCNYYRCSWFIRYNRKNFYRAALHFSCTEQSPRSTVTSTCSWVYLIQSQKLLQSGVAQINSVIEESSPELKLVRTGQFQKDTRKTLTALDHEDDDEE